jgi:hypothetical protein
LVHRLTDDDWNGGVGRSCSHQQQTQQRTAGRSPYQRMDAAGAPLSRIGPLSGRFLDKVLKLNAHAPKLFGPFSKTQPKQRIG